MDQLGPLAGIVIVSALGYVWWKQTELKEKPKEFTPDYFAGIYNNSFNVSGPSTVKSYTKTNDGRFGLPRFLLENYDGSKSYVYANPELLTSNF